jgi:phosphohistidine phosphatase
LGLVLCSTAARALETAERLLAAWPEDERPPLVPRPDLYGASPDQVLDVVRGMPDETASVMVVGHNPTMMALAALLATGGADSPFPTAGVAVYRFGLDRWEDVGQGTASELGRFAPPY